jgi:hypothetical protein
VEGLAIEPLGSIISGEVTCDRSAISGLLLPQMIYPSGSIISPATVSDFVAKHDAGSLCAHSREHDGTTSSLSSLIQVLNL